MAVYEAKTPDKKCPFCEIVSGNLRTPGVFWEDTEFMAFLAIDPNTEGFTCVIPKQHFGSDILKMPGDFLIKFIFIAKKVAEVLENYYQDVGRVGLIMEGTGINHAHIKLVPMHGTEYLKTGEWKQTLSNREDWFDQYEGWISSASGPRANAEELKQLAEKIRESQNS